MRVGCQAPACFRVVVTVIGVTWRSRVCLDHIDDLAAAEEEWLRLHPEAEIMIYAGSP
jgi:hypothetical protein